MTARRGSRKQRLERLIDREMADGRVRNASKLLQTDLNSNVGDIPLETKYEKLKSKFPDPGDHEANVKGPTFKPIFKKPSGPNVTATLVKMNKNAARCIDGWSRNLLLGIIDADPSIADDVAEFMTMIVNNQLNGHFETDFIEILRVGRLIGIPAGTLADVWAKVRPITISNLFLSLAGRLAVDTGGTTTRPNQYAIGKQGGAIKVIHPLRELSETNHILRLDMSNAYPSMRRFKIREALAKEDDSLRAYFECMYGTPSKCAMFGPGGKTLMMDEREGVRQGDAPSSMCFCKTLDTALGPVMIQFPTCLDFDYMDDVTIVVPKELDGDANLWPTLERELGNLGLKLNTSR